LTIKNNNGNFAVPYVNVTLKRDGNPSYYGQADANGVCKFRGIDPDTYDVYVSGPDFGAIGTRIEEEIAVTFEDFVVAENTEMTLYFDSTFSAELQMPDIDVEYTAKLISTFSNEYQVQLAGAGDVVSFTKPVAPLDIQYYISIEASPTPAIPAAILTESFETGDFTNPDWAWTLGGDVDPFVTDADSSEGTYSAEFGDIEDDQSSWMVASPNVPAGNYWLKFDIKLSTEEGWDFVYAYVDGQQVWVGSGIYDWQTITVPYLGGDVVFEYMKDGAVSEVGDTAWIDNIKIIPIPADYNDYYVTGLVTVNGHDIPVAQNLYMGSYVDEFELVSVPWTLF